MTLRKTLALTCAAFLVLASCNDDKESPVTQQFGFADKEINLKDANIYLVNEANTLGNTHVYRDYSISDGVYNGGDGWGLEDFTGATYYIGVELAVPVANGEIGAGRYPLFWRWSDQEDENANIGYFFVEMGEDEEYFTFEVVENAEGDEDVVVSGNVNHGEVMTIKFNGMLDYQRFDGTNWVTDKKAGEFHFKGTVEDVRESFARTSYSGQSKRIFR